jgi:hypothetical protein
LRINRDGDRLLCQAIEYALCGAEEIRHDRAKTSGSDFTTLSRR